tara:strand:- start:265 stop:1341 length:1077 start_codon:yes stop_codon:yes gene_type:complete
MNKIFVFVASIAIIIIIIFFSLKDKFDLNNLILLIQNQTGLSIDSVGETSLEIYPKIEYKNSNATISNYKKNLIFKNADIIINKDYNPWNPLNFSIKSNEVDFEGIKFNNFETLGSYRSDKVNFANINSRFFEGEVEAKGVINFNNNFDFKGKFKNISLNALFKQANLASWDRLKIKLSSNEFIIEGISENNQDFLKSLKGVVKISGSLFFVASDEERFGAALLSLFSEKLPSLNTTSSSINFILTNFSDIPTKINGKIELNNGLIIFNNIIFHNETGKSSLNGTFDFTQNIIDGKINFYKNDEIFIKAELKGNIEDPQILVDEKVFNLNDGNEPKDIKKLFEEGINSFVEKLLKIEE